MLTLFHAPLSRSSRLVHLLHELDAADAVTVETVTIRRHDGTGGSDARNPHPEGKVPLLVHDGVEIWESTAIALYLTELFPAMAMGVPTGDPLRGRFLSWLAWYGDVLEPLVALQSEALDTPGLRLTFRGFDEAFGRLSAALSQAPYLVGEHYTAADLIVASTFGWKPDLTPDDQAIKDWVGRCLSRPAGQRVWAADMAAMRA